MQRLLYPSVVSSKGENIRSEPIRKPISNEGSGDGGRTFADRHCDPHLLDDEAFAIFDRDEDDLPPDQIIRGSSEERSFPACFSPILLRCFAGLRGEFSRFWMPIDSISPQPGGRPTRQGEATQIREKETPGRNSEAIGQRPFCGLVFKIHIDERTGLYFVRSYSGHSEEAVRCVLGPRTGEKNSSASSGEVQADSRRKAGRGDLPATSNWRGGAQRFGDGRHALRSAAHAIPRSNRSSFPSRSFSMAIETGE